jgi:hypothetical protein
LWTYTAYILEKYPKENKEVAFQDLDNFIFDILWRKFKLAFHDGEKDLYLDLKYMGELGILDLDGNENEPGKVKIKVKDEKALNEVVQTVERSHSLSGIDLFKDYKERIDSAMAQSFGTP